MAIATSNVIGDITPEGEKLLGRVGTTNVIQRVNRNLPRWTAVTAIVTINPEIIHKLNTGCTEVTLAQKGGLYQVFNATTLPITVRAVTFADGTNVFQLDPGVFAQFEGYIDSGVYKFSKLSVTYGTGGGTTSTPESSSTPANSETYAVPSQASGLIFGNHKLVAGTTYTLNNQANVTAGELPGSWNLWLQTGEPPAKVQIGATSAASGVPIFYKDLNTWLPSSSNPDILVSQGEMVTVTLRVFKDSGERAACLAAIPSLDSAIARCYEVKNSWRLVAQTLVKNNFVAIAAPTVDADITEGYSPGSLWCFGNQIWVCRDNKDGGAIWVLITETPATTPVAASPQAKYLWVDAFQLLGANTGTLIPGAYTIRGGSAYTYGLAPNETSVPPERTHIIWNTGNTSSTIQPPNESGILYYNEVTKIGGYQSAVGVLTIAPGEIWEIIYRVPSDAEKVAYQQQLTLVTLPQFIRHAKRLSANSDTLKAFGNSTVIRVANNIDGNNLEESRLYLFDSLGLGTFNLLSFGKIVNNQGTSYSGTTTATVDNKTQTSLPIFVGKNQFLAYRIGSDIVIWQLNNSGIQSGNALPSDTSILIFRLVSHASLPDGLYTRDRNLDWVI